MDGSLCGTAFYTPSPPYSVPLDLSTRGELFRFTAADNTITPLVRLNQRAGLPTANLLEDSDGNSYSLGFVYPVTEATTPPPAPLPTPVPEVVLDKITLAGQRTVFPVAPGYTRGLTMGQAGNFYVAITETAVESASSTATIFAVSPDNGTKAALYEFSGLSSADPATAGFPLSRLIQAADGSLYGLAADANSTFIYRLDVTAPSVTLTASVPTVRRGRQRTGQVPAHPVRAMALRPVGGLHRGWHRHARRGLPGSERPRHVPGGPDHCHRPGQTRSDARRCHEENGQVDVGVGRGLRGGRVRLCQGEDFRSLTGFAPCSGCAGIVCSTTAPGVAGFRRRVINRNPLHLYRFVRSSGTSRHC